MNDDGRQGETGEGGGVTLLKLMRIGEREAKVRERESKIDIKREVGKH